VGLQPEHLSCYGLTLEEGTPLYSRRKEESFPGEDLQSEMYLWAVDFLEKQGFNQYEISNFARNHRESRHNFKYWNLQEYAGFGPGAHSDFGHVRYAFERDLEGFLSGMKQGGPLLSEREFIPPEERDMEYIMLRLRTRRGVDSKEFTWRFRRKFDCFLPFLNQCQEAGYAVEENGGWHLTPRGFLVSNQVIGGMLEALAQDKRRQEEGRWIIPHQT
jgi:oxygen-independent coproporphyrinogen-3 oxidase